MPSPKPQIVHHRIIGGKEHIAIPAIEFIDSKATCIGCRMFNEWIQCGSTPCHKHNSPIGVPCIYVLASDVNRVEVK